MDKVEILMWVNIFLAWGNIAIALLLWRLSSRYRKMAETVQEQSRINGELRRELLGLMIQIKDYYTKTTK